MTYSLIKILLTLSTFGLVPFTLSQATTLTTSANLNGNFIKPIKNNGNTIKPVNNNMNNVYNVYVEQHHHFDSDEEKGAVKDQNGIEVLGTSGVVSLESEICCLILK